MWFPVGRENIHQSDAKVTASWWWCPVYRAWFARQ